MPNPSCGYTMHVISWCFVLLTLAIAFDVILGKFLHIQQAANKQSSLQEPRLDNAYSFYNGFLLRQ